MFTLIELILLLTFGASSFFAGMIIERQLQRRHDLFRDRWRS